MLLRCCSRLPLSFPFASRSDSFVLLPILTLIAHCVRVNISWTLALIGFRFVRHSRFHRAWLRSRSRAHRHLSRTLYLSIVGVVVKKPLWFSFRSYVTPNWAPLWRPHWTLSKLPFSAKFISQLKYISWCGPHMYFSIHPPQGFLRGFLGEFQLNIPAIVDVAISSPTSWSIGAWVCRLYHSVQRT